MIIKNKTLVKVEESDCTKSFKIPDGIEYIGEKAFYNCKNIEFVYIPESVKEIGKKAFWGCESLKALTIPKNVLRIGMYAIDYCKNMEILTIESEKLLNCVKSFYSVYPNFQKNLLTECLKLRYVIVPDSTTDNNIIFTNMEKRKSQTYKILREKDFYKYIEKNKNRMHKETFKRLNEIRENNVGMKKD